jgi:hypothetical protein
VRFTIHPFWKDSIMFTTDAFGQRVLCSPRLSFMAPKADPAGGGGGGGGGADDQTVEFDGEKFAFPAKTAVADMTPEQKAEYWRHEAKKQQGKAPKKPADYDQLQADAAELARIRAEQTPKDQREAQERLDEARREGENIGAQRYLGDAIFGRIQGITGLDDDVLNDALEPVDPTYFVDAEGNLDAEKIKKFAGTLAQGSGGQGNVPDPVRDVVRRQQPAGGGGTGGQSMQERREAARERMTPKSKKTTT